MAPTSMQRPSADIVSAPASLVWLAVGALTASALLLVSRSLAFSVVGYLLAPLAVTILVSVFRYADVKASRSNTYGRDPKMQKIATTAVLLSFAIGLFHAWIIATDIAKAIGS